MARNTPQALLETISHAYYEEKDLAVILACVTDDVEWIGTESEQTARGKAALAAMLREDFALYPQPFGFKIEVPRVQPLGTDGAILTVAGQKLGTPGAAVRFDFRGTICCVRQGAGWLVSHLHFSAPNTEVEKESLQTALAEERAKQKALLEYVPGGVAIYRVKKDGRIMADYISDGLAKSCGYADGKDALAAIAQDVRAFVLPEDYPAVAAACKISLEQGVPTSIRYRVYTKQREIALLTLDSVLMHNVPLDADDAAVFYAVQTRQSDERQKRMAEEEVRRKLMNNMPGGVAIYHLYQGGRVTTEYVSDALAAMCGYTTSEFLAYLKADALVNLMPEDLPAVRAAVEKGLQNNHRISLTYRVYKKDGTPLLTRLDANVVTPERPAEGEIATLYAVHTVVSEESRRIIEEQKSLSLLLNSVPAGIGIYEVKNGVLNQEYMNDAFFSILHSTRKERARFSGSNAMEAIHPKDRAHVGTAIGKLVDGLPAIQVEYRLLNGLGTYTWFNVSASVAERKENYIRFFIAFSNCDESKQKELQLLQNQRAVELAQTQGDLTIWTYNIDRRVILQQIQSPEKTNMGYRMQIENVPECLIAAGDVYPDDVEKVRAAYRDLDHGKEKLDATYRLRDARTGRFTWLRMFYQRMESNDANERMAVGFSMNVEKEQQAIERYRVEQVLREQMNENVLMYMEYDLTQNRFETAGKTTAAYADTVWNTAAPSDFLANLARTVEPAYLDEVAEKLSIPSLIKAYEAGKTKVTVELRGRVAPEAPRRWYRTGVSLAKRPDTGDIMAFIAVEDVDEHKNRQLAVESSLSDGVENVALIHVADRQRSLVVEKGIRVPAGKRALPRYDEDFIRRSAEAIVPEDRAFGHRAALLSTVVEALARQEVYEYSVTTQWGGGPRKRQLFRYRYLDDRKECVVMSVVDVTTVYLEDLENKRRLEDALREAQQASHAKAEFYSRMSHDMRTPMNGILGMAELSEEEIDPAKLKENIGKIKDSGQYLLSLINDTLDIQRIESGKMKLEPTLVCTMDMVRNILEMVEVSAKAKGVNLVFERGNTDLNWYVRADPLRMKQIFVNLLSNAIKFTPAGGTVSFECKLLSREGLVSHDVIYVRDTGCGMSKAFLENGIFKPFSQESNAVSATYAGSGLGLSIAKSLVEMMGGRIEVESELGTGTTFAVTLDFERVPEAEAKAALLRSKTQSQTASAGLDGKQLLLAEDHPLNAEIATRLLQKVGCKITWAKNGQEAVTRFAEDAPHTYDAILMDIRMPVMDGLEATRTIRALAKADAKTVPIIAMTANAYAEDVANCLAAGMNAHLGKPIAPKEMYDTLNSYLAR